jgi:Tfp pilus assembly pilus retraction ATPase PilT
MIVSRLLRNTIPTLNALALPPIFKQLAHRENGIVFLA